MCEELKAPTHQQEHWGLDGGKRTPEFRLLAQLLHISRCDLHPIIESGRGLEAKGRVQSVLFGGRMRGHVMLRYVMSWGEMRGDASRD